MPDIFSTYEEVQRREEEKRTGIKSLTKEEADTMVCGVYPKSWTNNLKTSFLFVKI